jgi:hypothetical protein
MTDEQERDIEQAIERYIGKLSVKGWALLAGNLIVLMSLCLAAFSWKKDIDASLIAINKSLASIQSVQTDIEELKQWKAQREMQGAQWQSEITSLKVRDEQQQRTLEALMQGQAEIKALLRVNR